MSSVFAVFIQVDRVTGRRKEGERVSCDKEMRTEIWYICHVRFDCSYVHVVYVLI